MPSAAEILVGLARPEVAVALNFGVAGYAIMPFREVAQVLFGRS